MKGLRFLMKSQSYIVNLECIKKVKMRPCSWQMKQVSVNVEGGAHVGIGYRH